MKPPIDSRDIPNLVTAVNVAIAKSLTDRRKSEPILVSKLVWHIPREIKKIKYSGNVRIESAGVFVHQQPRVKSSSFPDKRKPSVEIGDLLLLRTGKRAGVVVDQRAFLLQAKKCDRIPTTPDNKNQYYLYANWPDFVYVNSTPGLNGRRRHVIEADIHEATKYMLIEKTPHVYPPCAFPVAPSYALPHACGHGIFTAYPTLPSLTIYQCFNTEMIAFILGDAGKTYKSPLSPGNISWDCVVDDLIRITANRPSSIMERTSYGSLKNRGNFLAYLTGDIHSMEILSKYISPTSHFTSGPPDNEYHDDGDETGGISIIEFVVESEGEIRG